MEIFYSVLPFLQSNRESVLVMEELVRRAKPMNEIELMAAIHGAQEFITPEICVEYIRYII